MTLSNETRPLRAATLYLALAGFVMSTPLQAAEMAAPIVPPPAPAKAPPPPVYAPPAPPTYVPPPPLPTVTPTEESRASAFKLAELLNSEKLTRRQLDKAYTETLPKVYRQNPAIQQLEEKYPGIIKVLIDVERDNVEPNTIARLPELQHMMGDLISTNLTGAEIKELFTFYSSNTGTKVLNLIAEGTDMSALAKRNMSGDDSPMTGKDIEDATKGAATPMLAKALNAQELIEAMRIGASPAGQKWVRLQKLILESVAQSQNANVAELKAKMEPIIQKAVLDFIQKSQAAPASPK